MLKVNVVLLQNFLRGVKLDDTSKNISGWNINIIREKRIYNSVVEKVRKPVTFIVTIFPMAWSYITVWRNLGFIMNWSFITTVQNTREWSEHICCKWLKLGFVYLSVNMAQDSDSETIFNSCLRLITKEIISLTKMPLEIVYNFVTLYSY